MTLVTNLDPVYKVRFSDDSHESPDYLNLQMPNFLLFEMNSTIIQGGLLLCISNYWI
jgi:hypothetical protein